MAAAFLFSLSPYIQLHAVISRAPDDRDLRVSLYVHFTQDCDGDIDDNPQGCVNSRGNQRCCKEIEFISDHDDRTIHKLTCYLKCRNTNRFATVAVNRHFGCRA